MQGLIRRHVLLLLLWLFFCGAPQSVEAQAARTRQKSRRNVREEQAEEQSSSSSSEFYERWESGSNGNSSSGGGEQQKTTTPTEAFSALFQQKKPRHVFAGLKNAVLSVVIGTTLGGVTFFAFPLAGCFGQGHVSLAGLAAGVVAGSLSAVVVTFAAVVHGVGQVLSGAVQTLPALKAAFSNMMWDEQTEEWTVYYMSVEREELAAREKKHKEHRTVRSTGYYDLLNVRQDASQSEIKKAYYRLAKELHPDKNPGSAHAADKFRHLHGVYRILKDDDKRANYDAYGERDSDSDESSSSSSSSLSQFDFDAYTFFAVLFGSQLVETYIGELAVPSVVDQLVKLTQSNVKTDLLPNLLLDGSPDYSYKRQKRQLEISLNLLERVSDFENEMLSKEAFRESCILEAERIAESPSGEKFLVSIGSTLAWEAGQYLGFSKPFWSWPRGCYYLVRKQIRGLIYAASCAFKTVGICWSTYVAVQEQIKERDAGNNENNANEGVEEMLPAILELTWSFNMLDISSTLNGACRRLFADADADSLTRKKRGEAVQILGEEFLRRGIGSQTSRKETKGDAEHNIKARLEVAMQVSRMKASGQDVPKDSEAMIKRRSNDERKRARRERQ